MGAVSSLQPSQRVQEEVPVNHLLFGGGYLDDWGSAYSIEREDDGRLMLKFDFLGGYLSENCKPSWEEDRVIKAVRENRWSGVFSLWAMDRKQIDSERKGEVYDLDYGFINNELMFVSQNGIVFWKSEAFMGTIDELVVACKEVDKYFFDYDWTTPVRMASTTECANFPLRREYREPSREIGPTISYVERESAGMAAFMKTWMNSFISGK